jgi:hypothetical protein
MPLKPAPSEPADYRRWKSRAAALLERQGLSLGVMLERDWRQRYIRGVTPEDAADPAQALLEHARFEQMGKRRPTSWPSRSSASTALMRCSPVASISFIARADYREAARMYPDDKILLCQGMRVIERSR